MSDLATIQAGWDHAARENATFNILTDPTYSDGWPLDVFFAHGRVEIDDAIARLNSLGVEYGTGRALDFGCGVGRLTQALRHHFRRADGVDVSDEMVKLARSYDEKCSFYHNPRPDLQLFKARTFDFVYSMIVLQHMPQSLQEGYVREFFRVLKPSGIAMFEIPDGPDVGHVGWHLSMYGVSRATVEQWIDDAGGSVVDVELLEEPSQWQCYRYTAKRG